MRLRRRKDDTGTAEGHDGSLAGTDEDAPAGAGLRADGPWDADERTVSEDDEGRAHLGSLSILGRPDVEVRLQVDEASGQVMAVMLVAADGAMELRPFADPRNDSIWDDVRSSISEEAQRIGGRAQEVEGPYGTALQLEVPAVGPDGEQGRQQSVVMGISGPRWLLRVTMFGRPAVDYRPDAPLETALREVVVIRGSQPMTPGESLPLVLPAQAQRVPRP